MTDHYQAAIKAVQQVPFEGVGLPFKCDLSYELAGQLVDAALPHHRDALTGMVAAYSTGIFTDKAMADAVEALRVTR